MGYISDGRVGDETRGGNCPHLDQKTQFSLLLRVSFTTHTEQFTPNISGHDVCGGVLPQQAILLYQLGIQEFNSVLPLSTWRWHQIPQLKDPLPQDCSHPPQKVAARPFVTSSSDPWAVNLRFPQPSPWGLLIRYSISQNSGKHIYHFMKGYFQDTDETREGDAQSKVSQAQEVPSPWSWDVFPSHCGCVHSWKLSEGVLWHLLQVG